MSLLIAMCRSSLTSSVQSDQEPLLKALLKEVEDWLENNPSTNGSKGFPATLDWLMTIYYIIPLNKRVKLSLPSSNPPSSPLQHLHSGPQPDPFIAKH
ncbi:hypothetical protein DFJ58DRAFT_731576 [Suillus subalutaceus]|uniref:uncharacterized protein n=1 Tax=Suillus subalutaceus TaxID=48586 RepID=UPI001B863723|nr:uncharacterized protein DFJ58DRAFT_731576 [Suillus subalutaceus]KAG1843462.1 hypothetical protein DFJ58DRAFT_731576 [Suillus subalutaceus]